MMMMMMMILLTLDVYTQTRTCQQLQYVTHENKNRKKGKNKLGYLVPTILIPHKRQVISNFERAIFVKQSYFTATPRSPGQPNHKRILLAVAWFKEKVEHPAPTNQLWEKNNKNKFKKKNEWPKFTVHYKIIAWNYNNYTISSAIKCICIHKKQGNEKSKYF